ncbi:hypothetical protein COT44_03695 [Candidatus Shapirobacteria bacterium CG08_land_8_20_14_0_20_39_18]|uniref:Uncharacterized protein n=1 Tax=Candidatus Shapirobacteria bacterium CG08_land_8_20_14_0_20_39_18 TaxID=1974883 RepID=A0A2M6XCA6_9BACT|nr:MAG: hypothetical protein COT44_03695 [Candidatus Shapirobacteria bacterium CG08_land_8_20_14_0_20_39_18]PIY64741.1 MAG: hypothetical protein COY91_04370 [Candidatus Shapirobacteria bacterium CG_4_10_14_0_8_um_filter_39_15]
MSNYTKEHQVTLEVDFLYHTRGQKANSKSEARNQNCHSEPKTKNLACLAACLAAKRARRAKRKTLLDPSTFAFAQCQDDFVSIFEFSLLC